MLFILGFIGAGLIGCQKDSIQKDNNSVYNTEAGMSTDGKMLIFKSIQDYENAIENKADLNYQQLLDNANSLNFNNYLSSHSNSDVENKMDDFFGQLLNEDGAIQIGNHIFKIDLNSEKVYSLNINNRNSSYKDLLKGNSSNKDISVFSTGDDVIDLLENGSIEKSCGGIGGDDYVTSVVDFGNNVRCQGMVSHFRAGIYFRTTARFEPLLSGVIYSELEIKNPEAWARRRPCNSNSITTSSSGVKKSGTSQQIWQFYSGVRNLNGLYLFARVKCTYNGVTKYSSWGGRNVNSPY